MPPSRLLPDIVVATIKSGDGVHFPTPGMIVNVHYCAFLSDGTKFDSSRDRARPLRFKVGAEAVIPGLDLAIARLTIGERLVILLTSLSMIHSCLCSLILCCILLYNHHSHYSPSIHFTPFTKCQS